MNFDNLVYLTFDLLLTQRKQVTLNPGQIPYLTSEFDDQSRIEKLPLGEEQFQHII